MGQYFNELKNSISELGQNIQFVAFVAHMAVAYAILCTFPSMWLAMLIIVFAFFKEFWFDAKYEKDPPQTTMDNLEDFSGYALGVLLAGLAQVIRIS